MYCIEVLLGGQNVIDCIAGMCFEILGTVIGVFVYTMYYLGLANSSTDSCQRSSEEREPDSSLRAAYRWHGLTLGCFAIIFVFVTFITVREQSGELCD